MIKMEDSLFSEQLHYSNSFAKPLGKQSMILDKAALLCVGQSNEQYVEQCVQ